MVSPAALALTAAAAAMHVKLLAQAVALVGSSSEMPSAVEVAPGQPAKLVPPSPKMTPRT